MSVLREAFSRLINLSRLTLTEIVRELNATVRRKEEARIYHWWQRAGTFPPSRREDRDQGGAATPCARAGPMSAGPRPPPEQLQ